MGVLLWVILIGFISGVIARIIMPGPNTQKGFIFTILLGLAGAFLATLFGETTGLLPLGRGAGFIGATIGAIVILFIWNRLVALRLIRDHGL